MALWAQIKKAQILGDSGRGAGGCLVEEVRLGIGRGALGPHTSSPGGGPGLEVSGEVRRSSRNVDFRAYLKGAWWLLSRKK